MTTERPILVLSASTGAGHVIAAQAVAAALRETLPDQTVEAHDVLQITGPLFRRLYGGGYAALVRHLPALMGWLYDLMDQPGRGRCRARTAFQDLFVRPLTEFLRRRQPRLIINTHFLPAEVVARLRRAGQLDCPQVTVTTDFETHRIWVQPPTERYYTATERGRMYLAACGVPRGSILVTGIPVRPGFEKPVDRETARARLGLATDRPVVLLLASAGGVASAETLLCELMAKPHAGSAGVSPAHHEGSAGVSPAHHVGSAGVSPAHHVGSAGVSPAHADVQIVVIAGHNAKLQARLEARAGQAGRRPIILGFTDRMHEWMQAADLLVSKPGGLTTAEALVCGVPLVIVNPIPGQETRNSDYLLEHGAAIKVNHPLLLGQRVSRLLGDYQRLAIMRMAARTIAQPGAAARIAQDVLELLRTRQRSTCQTAAQESAEAGRWPAAAWAGETPTLPSRVQAGGGKSG